MAKQDTLTLLDELEEFGLEDCLFRRLHQFGGSLNSFKAFCSTVRDFRRTGCNQLLHERLAHMLKECKHGALKSQTLDSLSQEAIRQVPLHRFAGCTKHRIGN
jgi:hypothetical protein